MPDPRHDPTSCLRCEHVSPEALRRYWKHEPKIGAWHLIADGQDLMARLPRDAHFLTILSCCLGLDDFPARYHGPLYGEFDAEDPAKAFADLLRCIELLHTEYDCP